MNTKPRQRYTAEFKAQAVELISTGKPVSQIAEELSGVINFEATRSGLEILAFANMVRPCG